MPTDIPNSFKYEHTFNRVFSLFVLLKTKEITTISDLKTARQIADHLLKFVTDELTDSEYTNFVIRVKDNLNKWCHLNMLNKKMILINNTNTGHYGHIKIN